MTRTGMCAVAAALVFGLGGDFPGAVWGELLEFEFSGVVAEQPLDPDGDFPTIGAGDPFTGIFRYDTEMPDALGGTDPNFAIYLPQPPIVSLELNVGSSMLRTPNLIPPDVTVANDVEDPDFGLTDQFLMYAETVTPPVGFGGTLNELAVFFITTDTSHLTDTSLPTEFDLDDWDEAVAFFSGLSSSTGQTIDFLGTIDTVTPRQSVTPLRAGDADQDLDFDQLDLVRVQQAAKYLTGQPATWGEGDWNGAPGGSPGNPPDGDGLFNQADIVAALQTDLYLAGPYGALQGNGHAEDEQTSVGYNAGTGEVWVDSPAATELTSVNIESASGIFTGDPARNLGGSFDNDADNNLFKATFGSSFGTLSFGNVAEIGLSEDFVAGDLSVVGSLAGGGDLGEVDLIYVPVPEPTGLLLATIAGLLLLGNARRRR